MTDISVIHAEALQPFCPISPAIKMDQWKFQNVGYLFEPTTARQELWTAHGKELLGTKPYGIEPWPIAVAVTHRKVDFLTREVDVMRSGRAGARATWRRNPVRC